MKVNAMWVLIGWNGNNKLGCLRCVGESKFSEVEDRWVRVFGYVFEGLESFLEVKSKMFACMGQQVMHKPLSGCHQRRSVGMCHPGQNPGLSPHPTYPVKIFCYHKENIILLESNNNDTIDILHLRNTF